MKIAIDARMYGPKITGIGNYVKQLTDWLFKIDKDNEYVILMNEPYSNEFQSPNWRVKKIKVSTHWYSWREQLWLGLEYNQLVRREKIDIFHFPHFNVPITFRGKFLVTIHDLTPKFFPGPKVQKSLIRKLGYDVVLKSALKRAGKIIAVSQHTKNQIITNFKVSGDKITVVYNGINPTFQKTADCGIIKALKNKHKINKPFIFYTGVWREHKNLPGLLQAFDILRRVYNLDWQLVLGGDNKDQEPKIKEVIEDLRLGDNLVVTDFIPDEELSTFYSAAGLTVIPSFCEGFGFLALESLTCGTPVVAAKTTSVPEILGEAGLYFDPRQPAEMAAVMAKVIKNQELQQELARRGREVIKKYCWENCAKQTLDIYQNLFRR